MKIVISLTKEQVNRLITVQS